MRLKTNVNSISSSITERIIAGAGFSLLAAGASAVAYFNPTSAGFFPVCPFHAITGLNCPGCGLTRGFHALFHGDIWDALHFNLLIPFFALFFSYLLLSMFLYSIRGRGLSFRLFPAWSLYAFLAITFIFTIVRNLPFYPFSLLSI